MLFALLMTGCAQLNDLKEGVQGLTNPIVFEGVYLGVAPSEDDRIDLTGTPFEQDALAQVFLADAASADELEDAPVTGAEVSMLADASGKVALTEAGEGAYLASTANGLRYDDGAQATLSATFDGMTSSVSITPPAAPTFPLASQMDAGTAFTIDLSGEGYDNVLVAVVDLQSGEVTFDNRPDDIQALYELAHGSGAQQVAVPASAIGRESVYAVGVAGMVNADASGVENANTLLSAFVAGRFRFVPVSTVPN